METWIRTAAPEVHLPRPCLLISVSQASIEQTVARDFLPVCMKASEAEQLFGAQFHNYLHGKPLYESRRNAWFRDA